MAGVMSQSAQRFLPVELRADVRGWLGQWEPGDVDFVIEPPDRAVGERIGPPDFVVLGGADAGGEWLMARIADHPEVALNRRLVEAAHVFAPYCTAPFGPGEVACFHALFPRRSGQVIGHWSPDGLSYPWVPPLLAQSATRARLVVLVRDPIEQLRAGLDRTVATSRPHVGSNLADAVDRGYYAQQLRWLQRWYPKDQLLVLQYERCVADADEVLAQVFAFLGVDDSYQARSIGPPIEPARDQLAPSTRQRLVEMYAADVADLVECLPDLDLALWPNFAEAG